MIAKQKKDKKELFIFIVLSLVTILLIVWVAGRYGWKLRGFKATQGAVVNVIEVKEDEVKIYGSYPGSFPCGFIGYVSEEYDGKLYVGYKFSPVFGIFETGDFEISVKTNGRIDEIYTKTGVAEYRIWERNGLGMNNKRKWQQITKNIF